VADRKEEEQGTENNFHDSRDGLGRVRVLFRNDRAEHGEDRYRNDDAEHPSDRKPTLVPFAFG
jgi:hypothetical protein